MLFVVRRQLLPICMFERVIAMDRTKKRKISYRSPSDRVPSEGEHRKPTTSKNALAALDYLGQKILIVGSEPKADHSSLTRGAGHGPAVPRQGTPICSNL